MPKLNQNPLVCLSTAKKCLQLIVRETENAQESEMKSLYGPYLVSVPFQKSKMASKDPISFFKSFCISKLCW